MKKLFSIKCKGFFWVEEENSVYSIFDKENNSHRFYDANGKLLPQYQRQNIESSMEYDLESNSDEIIYNKYGVACGDRCLIDKNGDMIPNTELNLEDDCDEHNRYFTFSRITKEEFDSIAESGTAHGITLDVYDTKARNYVLRNIPESKLNVSYFDGEPEVIIAAVGLFQEFETIDICKRGTIIGRKDGWITVFDYYG